MRRVCFDARMLRAVGLLMLLGAAPTGYAGDGPDAREAPTGFIQPGPVGGEMQAPAGSVTAGPSLDAIQVPAGSVEAGLALGANHASAQSQSLDPDRPAALDSSPLPMQGVVGMGGAALKLGLALGAVLVLIVVLQRAARRWGGGLGGGLGSERIQLLSQRAVGPKLSLAVVQVMGRTLLVGISPHGIRPVADLGREAGAGESGRTADAFGSSVNPVHLPFGPGSPKSSISFGPGSPKSSNPSWWRRLQGRGAVAPRASDASTVAPQASDVSAVAPPRVQVHADAAPQPAVEAAAPSFASELNRRLESLEARYPSLRQVEQRLQEGSSG